MRVRRVLGWSTLDIFCGGKTGNHPNAIAVRVRAFERFGVEENTIGGKEKQNPH